MAMSLLPQAFGAFPAPSLIFLVIRSLTPITSPLPVLARADEVSGCYPLLALSCKIVADFISLPLSHDASIRHGEKRNRCRYWGVKRTCRFALQMSAFDPKRTLANPSTSDVGGLRPPFHMARLYRYDVNPRTKRITGGATRPWPSKRKGTGTTVAR